MDRHADILKVIEDNPDFTFRANWISYAGKCKLYTDYGLDSGGYLEFEATFRKILSDPVTASTGKLLEKLVIATEKEFPKDEWLHSICHLFEEYANISSRNRSPSFLNDPVFFPAAEILVNSAVGRLANDDNKNKHRLSCFERLMNPIAHYNLNQILHSGLDQPFAFKPASLQHPIIQKVYGPAGKKFWLHFIESVEPRSFFDVLVSDLLDQRVNGYIMPTIALILDKEYGRDAAHSFLKRKLGEQFINRTLEINGDGWVDCVLQGAIGMVKCTEGEITLGVFVDVVGTLLLDGGLNMNLATYLTYLIDQHVPVTIFTDGDVSQLSEQLYAFGLDARLLPVKRKQDFYGQSLEFLVDDTWSGYQSFSVALQLGCWSDNISDIHILLDEKIRNAYNLPRVPEPAKEVLKQLNP
jgi:hypothetical protein